ncbi:MAG: B12-binding domain-containing radical SAM protein [Candidatus Riflebacteria bacterium]|nr:B12-binding domain-containing radical SAM protein [Candidatus Riflebacteria bacterium]
MRALLINPAPAHCYYSFPEARRIAGKKCLGIPLGLITVASLLPPDWQFRLVEAGVRPPTDDDWAWADIILFSGNSLHRQSLLDLIRESRRRGKRVVAGGPYVTYAPEEVLAAGADLVARGEGEATVPLLLEALETGRRQAVLASPEKPAMSSSPVPRFDLLDLELYVYVQVQASRGCPHDCEYCDIVARYGRAPRYKSPSQVTAELDALYRLGWRGHVFVADDNFIGDRASARSILCRLYEWQREHHEPFSFNTQATVALGRDREMIDLFTRANFGDIFVGIETLDQDALKLAGKSHTVTSSCGDWLDTMVKNGLSALLSFIIGFDGEKKGAGERICQFVEERAVPVVMINTLWAIPDTRLWNRLRLEGRLHDRVPEGNELVGGRCNFVPSRPEPEILDEFVRTWDRLYEPTTFVQRAYRYYLAMRPTRAATARRTGQPDDTVIRTEGRSLKGAIHDLRKLMRLLGTMGVREGCRLSFWKSLFGLLRKNPSRVVQFLNACGHGPDLFRIREMLLLMKRPVGPSGSGQDDLRTPRPSAP